MVSWPPSFRDQCGSSKLAAQVAASSGAAPSWSTDEVEMLGEKTYEEAIEEREAELRAAAVTIDDSVIEI